MSTHVLQPRRTVISVSFENELTHLWEDLVDTLNAWVVKAVNSQMVRLYSPNKETALVF
jgi:hypothetical protein